MRLYWVGGHYRPQREGIMGHQDIKTQQNSAAIRRFTRHIMQDMRALDFMLEQNMFETEVQRIGAEQELF